MHASAKGISWAASFFGSSRTRKGAIDRRGRPYRRQSWAWPVGTIWKSWRVQQFFPSWKVRKLSSRYPLAQAPLAVTKGRTWRTVFAHGDLGPHNILWDTKRAEIAAIIDWEFSGWFPEYWEYTRAYFGPAVYLKNYGWWEMFQEYTQCYQEELDVEIVLSDYFTLNFWNCRLGCDYGQDFGQSGRNHRLHCCWDLATVQGIVKDRQ